MRSVVELVALRQSPPGVFTLGGRTLGGKQYVPVGLSGSGSIIDPGGVVLTNAHVVLDPANKQAAPLVEVRLTERPDQAARPAFLARVTRLDVSSDLAGLRIVADIAGSATSDLQLPALTLGSSEGLQPGDDIALLGYPAVGGQTITFTAGHVSGFVGADYVGPGRDFIKTDAKLSTGSSGGAALDDEGRLVAIPTSLFFDKVSGAPQETQNYLRPAAFAVRLLQQPENRVSANAP